MKKKKKKKNFGQGNKKTLDSVTKKWIHQSGRRGKKK